MIAVERAMIKEKALDLLIEDVLDNIYRSCENTICDQYCDDEWESRQGNCYKKSWGERFACLRAYYIDRAASPQNEQEGSE
jgi:hypothetical protein